MPILKNVTNYVITQYLLLNLVTMRQYVQNYWKLLADLGTKASLDNSVNNRIRLVNNLALIGIVYYLICCIIRALFDLFIPALEPFLAAIILSFVLLLNFKSYYTLSRLFHYVASIFIFTYFGIAHGEKDGAEYLLLITSIIGLLYLERKITMGILFVLNLICFRIIKYIHTQFEGPVESVLSFSFINLNVTFVALFSIIYYFKQDNQRKEAFLNRQKKSLAVEKERSERLLLNILPAAVAEELKLKGGNEPVQYEMATVMFIDFKDFTKISESMSAKNLVEILNSYFSAFDEIIQKHRIEKIKTIGDAYMCVGGVPMANVTNPSDSILAAIELQHYAKKRKEDSLKKKTHYFDLRIGIHTGPVIACVIGKSKFAYDIWGDTVNTSARLEATCHIGKINISGVTYEHVKDLFKVTHRGKVEAKHAGTIDMYYIEDQFTNAAILPK